mgnify:CR=1 FL=1
MVCIRFLVIFVKNIGNFCVFWCGFYILISVWNKGDNFKKIKKTTILSCLLINKAIYVDF